MRKSSGLVILVALLTITAPTAFADSFSIVFTAGTSGTPVDTSGISVPTVGVLNLGTVTYAGATFTFTTPLVTSPDPTTDTYRWDYGVSKIQQFRFFDTTLFPTVPAIIAFPSTPPNVFVDGGTATVVFNTVAAPEPSPVVLTLIGMGLLVVMRKRKALGLAQAT